MSRFASTLARQGQDCLSPTATEEKAMSNAFPKGWNEERVRQVLSHYESQSEDEQFAEIETAVEQEDTIMMAIPAKLAPEPLGAGPPGARGS
jgi:hypothetical protein